MREKVGKSRNTVFFQWFVAPEGRKVGSLKRRVRSQLARWDMKKCTPLWRKARFEVKMYKTHQRRTTFGSWDVEKVDAVVARSKFQRQNVQNTPRSDHFWKLRCPKSARRCGAKYISKSKCTKHTTFGPLLEVAMSKKCTPLWREAHFEVKMYKTPHVSANFGGSDVVSLGRRKGLCTLSKVSKTWGFCSIFNYNHHYTTLHYNYNYTFTTFHYTTLHYTTLHSITLNYTTLRYITLHYTITLHYYTTLLHYTITLQYYTTLLHYTTLPSTFHYTSLHYTTLHSTTLQLHYNYTTTLHYTPLRYTTLHSTTLPSTTLHYITLHYAPLRYNYNYNYNYTTTLHYTKLHYTTLHYTTLHYLPLHSTTLHYITLYYITLNDTVSQVDK